MQTRRARSAALVSGLAILLGGSALVAPGVARAQAAAAQQGAVQRIIVVGNERIEQSTILSYLPIGVGDTVDPARIDLALKALFRTDLFSDVKVGLSDGDLTIQVVENPIINRVVFEGNSGLKEDKLRDEITVRPRGIFTRAKVQSDVQRIIELYRRSGRISAAVTPKIVELPQKRVDLIFEISEGEKSGVLGVNFLGNVEFSDNDLRDVVVTEESAWYRFFSNNANYDPDRLEYDKEQLRKHYRNRGFYDFRVISAVAELSSARNGFAVTYTLEEGPRYRFGKISVETELKKLDTAVLTQLVPIRSGDLYEDERIETATDALTFAAGAAGFASVDVRPRYVADPATRTVNVVFQVNEGPRVYVNRIDIIGNTQTLDHVIRRELNLVEGDAYNRALVDRSENNLKALGFFKEVTIEETPTANADRTDLLVTVEEQATGELTFSAGYSSVDQLMIDLGITQRNFRGRGQDARARVSWGSYRQQLDFSFTEPRFLDRNLRAGVDLYYFVYDLSDYSSYRTTSLGTNLRIGFPLTADAFMTMRYVLREDDVDVPGIFCDPSQQQVSQTLCDQRGRYTTSLLGYQVTLDRRNDPVRPTRGFFVSLAQDLAGLGGDVNYLRSELEGGWYYGFNKDFVLSLSGSAGYIGSWGDDVIRINDRFYKGGNSFRGFRVAGIGPRDISFGRSDALGGEAFAIGSAELTIPTFIPQQYGIRASVFTDVGTLGILDDKIKTGADGQPIPGIYDDLSLRASAGLSVFWRSPMGPIRFDFSQILQREDYDRVETFRFSQTTKF
ncbi:MAG: outer membrane protein assembly factor BamA [Phenylobacterium sp.]|jgi:outer membrane protein insertion porin family|uniref:outer membrane protein assembly factor BamA n=2 Tax=Phenylobacterium sp. TaxID=1871053 RepID=UPI0025D1F832|nr:outer membrane protein assembly factor BamA [Phenylobacterium sp.]MCA3710937.1 outer membrane protein assembly factor BamA [Phenylobacterium sp.]MCA3750159.1 outer membrane protein assembly factor BamA [Phenylobacterium sp.]MCA3757027.1 outer membrane protein assembly factor BamA [Phenylobacterium sp.]MCA6254232.1 outer membrane protein assembly factor BamA [Phenylobacterium sp.]MCA6276759.1 outer membrane protein assembly factor BamA [Phenylobacterium sp.]